MLLDIRNLKTHYGSKDRPVKAVDGISFTLERGASLGLVGKSGCGKTTAAKSINRILSGSGRVVGGEMLFKGRDLVTLSEDEMNAVRWKEISLITQSAMNALDPVYTAGDQIIEAIQTHESVGRREAADRAGELFSLVGLEKKRLWDYPHQLSGGMKQRVVIAMALALNPDLVIADEPTTALDVVVQDGIMKQLEHLQEKLEMALILVTHDISVVAETCPALAVMYAGRIMEYGATSDVLSESFHPYTMGLQNAFPTLTGAAGDLISIPGFLPDLRNPPKGCRFSPRCPFADETCVNVPPSAREVLPGHRVECHYPEKAGEFRALAKKPETWRQSREQHGAYVQSGEILLETKDLKKSYPIKRSFADTIARRPAKTVKALDGVAFSLGKGEILGLAGESGSGKTTLGELLSALQTPTSGSVLFENRDIAALSRSELRAFRRNMQVVFQDPYETLNPRFTVMNALMEPLKNLGVGTYEERLELVNAALSKVELNPPENYLLRFPHELSGGQRQRVAIARGIILEPRFLVADEPVSMLDVSIRAGILNLFLRFRREMDMSIIYVSHDLATIRYICDRTAILYLGRIAELGPTEEVISRPLHPYTEMLISAVPHSEAGEKRPRVDARGEIPDPIDLPNGCRFHPRCPRAIDSCGWEGRDLQRILDRALEGLSSRVILSSEERSVLSNVKERRICGTDIVLEAKNAEVVASLLEKRILAAFPAMAKACSEVEVERGSVRLRFPAMKEPEFRPGPRREDSRSGNGTEHFVACYLYG